MQTTPLAAPLTRPATALLLAAGRGERMRPLTDSTPKPLLQVQGKPLMQWPMEALAQGGVSSLVINTDWLGTQISDFFGANFQAATAAAPMQLRYSEEGRDFGAALETAGGIVRALPALDEVFWVAAGDVYAPQFRFSEASRQTFAKSGRWAHLWLVPNPPHNPRGDFGLSSDGLALNLPKDSGQPLYTFSTIALYRRQFFTPPVCDIPSGNPQGVRAALAPMLRHAMDLGHVSASLYTGPWTDVGTPERLAALNTP
jgi:MurNAc alpha-1-phosphate uridylyltransferase